ncbi:DUF4401 domain-containing protein [Shewanella sp.]|uniref:DUF4401 domain-containing protein n=1 Tax=Shewanella sp. TaxID=50422 RepID=UPI0035632FAA
MKHADFRQQLLGAGLLQDATDSPHQPLWLALFTGLAGWFAALFFLAFSIALIDGFTPFDGAHSIGVGMVYGAIAHYVYRRAGHLEFMLQFGFAVNIAAMAAIILGLHRYFSGHSAGFYLIGIGVLLTNAWFVRYGVDALVSLGAALVLAGLAFEEARMLAWYMPILLLMLVIFSGICLSSCPWQLRVHPFARRCQHALFVSVLLLPLLLDNSLMFGDQQMLRHGVAADALQWDLWVSTLLFMLLCAATFRRIQVGLGLALILVIGIAGVYWYFPGLALAIGLWLLGWLLRERHYVALSLLAVVGYFFAYYYEMSLSLLVKSVVLMLLGIAMALAGIYCKRRSVQ